MEIKNIFETEELELKKYLHIIFIKRWILFSVVAVIMAIDLIYTFKQIPIYRATSLVLIEKPSSPLSASKREEAIMPRVGEFDYYGTQYQILKSRTLAKRVTSALELKSLKEFEKEESPEEKFQKMVDIQPVKDTRLVKISVDYPDPVMATKMANTLSGLYIEQNVENMLFMSKDILKAFPKDAKEIERHTIYGQLKDISKEEAIQSLPSVVNNQALQQLKREKIEAETELANLSRRYKDKHPRIIALNTKLDFVNDRIEAETSTILSSLRADLAGRLDVNNIRIIDYAEVPKHPIKPKKFKNILLGLFFSSFLGIGIIFVSEYLDDTVKKQEDVENKLKLPYLGEFPILRRPDGKPLTASMLPDIDKEAEASQAIRNIRTNILYSSPKESLKSILITSTIPQEGKSFLSSYLSYSLAKNGIKTLLIDADIRRPQIHNIFEVKDVPGLVNILVESIPAAEAIRKTAYENLYMMPSGAKTPNPLELLSSEKMRGILKELSQKFDKIIIDSPPCFNISDSLVLSGICDAVILITKSGTISHEVAGKIKDKFDSIKSRVTGVIINFSELEKSSYYKYKYYHKYYKGYYSSAEKS